jgi:hypothetical protein
MTEGITNQYLSQGVLGVTVVVLLVVVKVLYDRACRLEQEKTDILKAWHAETTADKDKVVGALQNSSQALYYVGDKIQTGKNQ